ALKAANVDVSSRGGEVTLTGQVPDDSARLAAYKIASEAKGVGKVNDQMTVLAAQTALSAAPAGSAAVPANDAKPAQPAGAKTPSRKAAKPKPATAAEAAGASAGGGAGAVASTDSASAPLAQPAMATTPAAP